MQVGHDVALIVPYDAAASALRHLCAVQREGVPPADSRNASAQYLGSIVLGVNIHMEIRNGRVCTVKLTQPSGW